MQCFTGQPHARVRDDLQHFSSGGLLLQRLALLVQEPSVLHRDDRLSGEIL